MTAMASCGRPASNCRQKKLVGDIEFEVLRFDEVFKTSQIPIGKVERITGLKFHDTLVNNDTSDGQENPID